MKNQETMTIDIDLSKLTPEQIKKLDVKTSKLNFSNVTLKQIKSDKEFMENYTARKEMYGVGPYKLEYQWYVTSTLLDAELLRKISSGELVHYSLRK